MPDSDKPVVIVSGGSRGLGATLCEHLLDGGYIVCTFSRSSSDFVESHSNNQNFYWASVDISDSTQIKSFVQNVVARYGNIYGLINNAGISVEGVLATTNISDIENTIDVNLKSVVILTRLVVKHMIRNKQGSIVNLSSINAIKGHSGLTIYSATKAALDGLTRSLAKEVGKKGIRVNSVAPGYFMSDMVSHMSQSDLDRIKRRTPLGRLGKPEDIAGFIRFLMSQDSFITGQTVAVDGGLTC